MKINDLCVLDNVLIPCFEELEKKIMRIKNDGGLSSVHVISDYDSTITKRFSNGKKIHGSFALLRLPGVLKEEYLDKDEEMFDYYHPIELSLDISIEEKMEKMQEWWERHLQLVIDCGLTSDVLKNIVDSHTASFRVAVKDFFLYLHKNNVPLLIFSAGMGDFITAFLKKDDFLTPNIHVISNFLRFDELGKPKGYADLIVHTHNKSEKQLEKTSYAQDIKNRKNLVLIGDQLGDLGMSEGAPYDTSIRIGFLNDKVEELLPIFKKEFDIIILNDGSFDVINTLLSLLE